MDTNDALPPQHYYQEPGHVIAAGVVLSLLVLTAVVLRFWVPMAGKQGLKIDDWILLPAAGMTIAMGVCLVYGTLERAFGYRAIPTTKEDKSQEALEQMTMAIRLEWTISLILPFAMASTRASFVLFYKRIFSISKSINVFLESLLVFLVIWALTFFFIALFCCGNMAVEVWKPITKMYQCLLFVQILLAFCVTGFATDLVLIVIPIPLVWSLNLSTTNKIIASVSFLLGGATAAAALARMIVSIQFLQYATGPSGVNILDITSFVYWGMVESSVGVFAACLPILQVFFRRSASKWSSLGSFSSKARSLLGSGSHSGWRSGSGSRPGMSAGQNDSGIRVDPSVSISLDEKSDINRKESGVP